MCYISLTAIHDERRVNELHTKLILMLHVCTKPENFIIPGSNIPNLFYSKYFF